MTHEPVSAFFTSQRQKLHFVQWGAADAEPVVLLHGGLDHCRNWDDLARRLAPRWRLIAPDMRGHGDSDWVSDGDYGMSGMVFDLSELIRQLDLGPVRIVAHSLGGAVAVRLAALRPEQVARLVAIEGLSQGRATRTSGGEPTVAADLRRWMDARRDLAGRRARTYASEAEAAERLRRLNPRLTAGQADHLARHGLRRQAEGWSWKYDPALRPMSPEDITVEEVRVLWEMIACPVLMIYGADSWATDPMSDGRMAHFRDARRVLVEGAGHWVHHDRLDEVVSALEDFL